ncbi:MAG: LCP family protein [Firmicutes bacterium]|nr:LCP family protein [Bacillota bacterium]
MSHQTAPRRGRRVTLLIFLGLVLAALIGGAIYLHQLLGRIHYVDISTTPTLSQEQLDAYLASETEAETNTAPTMDPEDVPFAEHDIQIGGEGSDIVNILLIGQDRREGEPRSRSDSMILCTFQKSAKKLIMTSFLRDTYVKIPGYRKNRLNAAYAAGGMPLLNRTLEENFGVHIDGNVEVDFYQFAEIVDLLGGVELELRADEAQWVNRETGSQLKAGIQLLSGSQALAYARIRKLDADGDFSRTNRQRKVITALLERYRNTSLTEALSLLEQILPKITTDMTEKELLGYAVSLFPMLSGMEVLSQHIPAPDTYVSRRIDNMAVLVADLDANRKILEDTLGGRD